jgi:hypothetical protein
MLSIESHRIMQVSMISAVGKYAISNIAMKRMALFYMEIS